MLAEQVAAYIERELCSRTGDEWNESTMISKKPPDQTEGPADRNVAPVTPKSDTAH